MGSKVDANFKTFGSIEQKIEDCSSDIGKSKISKCENNGITNQLLKSYLKTINKCADDLQGCLNKEKTNLSGIKTTVNTVKDTLKKTNDVPNRGSSGSSGKKTTKTPKKKKLKEKIKKLLAGGHYKKANKAYKKLQTLIGKKEAKSWMNKAIKSTNAKAIIYGGAVVSISKAIKSIKSNLTTSLANNKLKKSNKYYKQLTKLLGKKESKKAVEEIIKSTGTAVCISSSKIKSIIKTDASDTGSNVTSADNVESLDANQLRDKAIEYIESKNEESALRDSNKAVLYEEATKKIEALDIKDPNYNQKVEEIKAELTKGCRELDAKWEQEVHKLAEDYSKYGDGIISEEETINNNLESVNDIGFQNVLTGKSYSAERLSEGEQLFANTLAKKQEEVNSYNQSINNNVIYDSSKGNTSVAPVTNDTQSSNESVAIETPVAEQKITYSKISSNTSTNNSSPKVTESRNNVEVGTTGETTQNTSVGTNTDTVLETEKNTTAGKIKDITDIAGASSSTITSVKKSSGAGAVIPAVLGVGAVGAAGVAGFRYVKNKKQNADIDESYDDENNSEEYANSNNESEYMKDDYLGPVGTEYMDASNYEASSDSDNIVPDNNSYTDTGNLETDYDDDDFSNDEAFNELS